MSSENRQQQETPVTSPCISHCTLDEEDICVGCFRHIDEITGWHGADNSRRRQILSNCAVRKKARPSFFGRDEANRNEE